MRSMGLSLMRPSVSWPRQPATPRLRLSSSGTQTVSTSLYQQVIMHDDGKHGDGKADGEFGNIPAQLAGKKSVTTSRHAPVEKK